MVGYVSPEGEWVGGPPICGISARKALCSLYYVRIVVVVVGAWYASVEMRMNQWSSGELVWVKMGVSGSPTWVSSVCVRRSARGLWYESCCDEGVACMSSPRRTDVFGCSIVRKVWSHRRVS